MTTPKKYDYNGQKLTVKEICNATGLALATVKERIRKGWPIAEITKPPDSVANRTMGLGRQIQTGITGSYLKVWKESGQAEFERQLAEAFKEDAIKVVKDMAFLMPKTNPEDTQGDKTPTCAIQINNVIPESDYKHFTPLQ